VFAPDGKSILAATESGKLTRYTADRLLYAGEVEADEAPLYGLARAGDRLFTLGRQSVVTVRDADTLDPAFDIPSQAPGNITPAVLAVASDGASVIVGSDKARLSDVKTRKELKPGPLPVPAAGRRLTQFAFSADGTTAVGRWGDAVTAVWDPKLGQPKVLEELPAAVPASPHALALTPDGTVALLGAGDGKLTAWDTSTRKVLFHEAVYPEAEAGEAIAAVAVLPKGTHFLTAGRDGRLTLWQLDGFRKVREWRGPPGAWRLAVAPDGRSVVAQLPGFVLRIDLPAVP
jgi:WD40 repeat protein